MAAEVLKKITVKTVCGKPSRDAIHAAGPSGVPMMELVGVASKSKPGDSQFGAYVAFLGRFEAKALAGEHAGKTFQSAKLIAPSIVSDQIEGLLGEGAESVQFALLIGVVRDDTVAVGYRFTVESLLPMAETDPLALLRKTVDDARKALPAPAAAPAPAPAPSPAPEAPAKGKGKGGK